MTTRSLARPLVASPFRLAVRKVCMRLGTLCGASTSVRAARPRGQRDSGATRRALGVQRSAAPRPLRPCLELSAEQAFEAQWEALEKNDERQLETGLETSADSGVEVLFAFALLDLYLPRSTYFGYSADLGQFERFRRVLHSPRYRCLLSHVERRVLSTVTEDAQAWQRVRVKGARGQETGEFSMALKRQLGGLKDGVWMTASLRCDAYHPWGPDEESDADE